MNKVINFHEVTDIVWFEAVVMYLKNRYKMITSEELYAFYYCGKKLHNSCLITVDDGHISSYDVIYPILKKHQVPAIFFVSPEIARREKAVNFWFQELYGYDKEKLMQISKIYIDELNSQKINVSGVDGATVDVIWKIIHEYQKQHSVKPKSPQNMTVEQIKEIDRGGLVEIGAHTLYHPFLANETDATSREEILFSIAQLETMLQRPIHTFAYPNGRPALDWGKREVEYLKETSVTLAFSTDHHDFSLSDHAYAIPRYGLTYGALFFIRLKLFLGKYYSGIKKVIK